ncbi:hypothetical protein T10_4160 [Trichinella papuae]|uniref:Uncharacterized protein n=1 Tax=Trichinella papuae TaxID=268474 RepID=A0A0V1N510_9BILA|nr:hypothetical protein T10_4160 [Trichinella papuae]
MIISSDDLDSVELISVIFIGVGSGSILPSFIRIALNSSFRTSYSMIIHMKLASCFDCVSEKISKSMFGDIKMTATASCSSKCGSTNYRKVT